MLLMLLLFVAYEGAEAHGAVISAMKNGYSWPEEGETKYKHYLECDYRHNFPGDPDWTYTYDIHCIRNEGESQYVLTVNYDNNVFDSFVVESCKLKDIVKSVFPPKQKSKYPKSERDSEGRPIISYLKYRTEDGKCHARKYQFVNRMAIVATRFTPEEIDCPGKPGWLKHGKVARFTNCRVPKLPLSNIVLNWSPSKPVWTKHNKHNKRHNNLLECSFDQFSKLFDLTCIKGDDSNEFFAFVSYQNHTLDRFSVTSCKEADIVNGIFPIQETTAHPKESVFSKEISRINWELPSSIKLINRLFGPSQPEPWVQKIWFSNKHGDCFEREYNSLGPTGTATKVDCPKYPDEWTNPTWGFAGQWRECVGPMSLGERAKKRS